MKVSIPDPARVKQEIKVISQLDLFAMSKQALIKKIQVLVHELKIYNRLQETSNEGSQSERIKKQVEMEIIIQSYRQNQEILEHKVRSMDKDWSVATSQLQQKDKEVNKLQRQLEIYMKKCQNYQKEGGRARMKKLQELQKQTNQKNQTLTNQNMLLKKQLLQVNNRCKILEEMNRETENRAAETICQLKNHSNYPINQKEDEKESITKENNPNKQNLGNHKQTTIQTMALKQQIKVLRDQLRHTQEGKEQLKVKMNQRQLFYSKMIASNY